MHGHYSYANLFEGNIVQNIQIDQTWGPSGPFNTFFRNRAELYGILMTSGTVESDSLNFVGNEVTNTGLFMGNYTLAGSNHFEFGNNVRGTITPAGTSSLPDSSYYLDSLPRFWNSSLFPTIGTPNYNTGSNAAKDRYLSGINLATCNEQINTSIADLNANVIDIYPNPASTSITVRFKTEMNHSIPISITDLTGKVLMEETLSTSSQFIEKTIDISVLKAGVYFLRTNGSAKIFVLSK
ncbi:MAG: T9SS type A sorting domain-containing protein [Bacteroidia bacterium]